MEVRDHGNGAALHATKKEQRPLPSQSDRGWSVRRKSGDSPNGFGLLAAAPGDGSTAKDPRP